MLLPRPSRAALLGINGSCAPEGFKQLKTKSEPSKGEPWSTWEAAKKNRQMVPQMHTAALRAKIKKLLAPEGLSHSELRVDASREGNSPCPAGAREPPCARPAP